MQMIARIAERRPFVFVLCVVLAWFLVGAAAVAGAALSLRTPMTDIWPQTLGTLAATGSLLLVASRLGWLRPMGFATIGTWSTWALTILIGAYVVLAGFYAFFGEVSFDARSLLAVEEARVTLVRQAAVGFVEETVFRGVLLYALIRAWGGTKRGVVRAVVVQAALFAAPHALQALVGLPPLSALANVANTFVTGLWLGLLVLSVHTLWPAVVLHGVSNASILVKGLSSTWVDPTALGYVRATLFELLLVLLGTWIVLRVQPLSSISPAWGPTHTNRKETRVAAERLSKSIYLPAALVLTLMTACSAGTAAPSRTYTPSKPWIEEDVTFSFGSVELLGILTLPAGEGPHPAIVLISGSANPATGARNGASHAYFVDHARHMVLSGFAVLRYDPPGVGRSTGEIGFESLELRTEEALAALRYLQSRPDIQPNRVGLWGVSQGGWVIAMAAAEAPEDVAFIIADSASGVSVAEQQVYGIEAQSRAAGVPEEDVAKATLFGRLLIDWQLSEPIYQERNEAEAEALGDGPWTEFATLVYKPGDVTPAQALERGIEVLKSIQDEPWARFLYLKEAYLPQLESIPPEQVMAVRAMMAPNLLNDPQAYLTRVRCPVLAAFGEDDLLVPAQRSADLYKQYLAEAGNEDVKTVVIPGVEHAFGVTAPGYADLLSEWLDHLDSGEMGL